MENARIGKDAVVNYSILDEETVVPEGSSAGEPRKDGGKLNVYSGGAKFEKAFKERRRS